MDEYQLALLLEHLGYWLSAEEVAEVSKWAVPAEEVARDLARRDLVYFARRYLRSYFTLPFSVCHWQLFEDIERALSNGERDQVAESLPRGFGKSTISCIAAPLWCIVGDGLRDRGVRGAGLLPRKHYIFLIKDSFDQSRIELADLKREIEQNDLFRQDFGDLVGETWAASTIVTANGVRVDALGTGMKVRGRRHGPHRPDLVVGDDLENDRLVDSEAQRKRVKRWWFRAVLKAGSEDCDFVVVNTILHQDSLQAYLLQLPDWQGRKWRALIRHADNEDLWARWEEIYRNLEDEDRRAKASAFYAKNEAEMVKGSEVLWPERFPYVALREMMLSERTGEGRVSSFAQEMQNLPVDPSEQYFTDVSFWHYEVFPNGDLYLVPDEVGEPVPFLTCQLYGACDPSLGLASGDFTALVDILVSPRGRMFVVHAEMERLSPDEIVHRVVDRAEYWSSRGIRYSRYAVESVQFQRLLAGLVASAAIVSGARLPVEQVNSQSNKNVRIASLVPDLRNGYLLLYREKGAVRPGRQIALYEQMVNWPAVDHDDGLDALEMARTLASAGGRGTRATGGNPVLDSLTVQEDPFAYLSRSEV